MEIIPITYLQCSFLASYKDEKNNFDARKYFQKFLVYVYEILTEMEKNWPPFPNMTMKKLSVHYVPCCFKQDFQRPEVRRCHHQDFTTPSLTRSKIGNGILYLSLYI